MGPIIDCEIDDEFTKPDFSSKKIQNIIFCFIIYIIKNKFLNKHIFCIFLGYILPPLKTIQGR